MSRVCAITVNFRGATDTAACVASLVRSTEPVSIVVIDNTPDDPDLEAALAPYPTTVIIRAHENLGFGRGSNLGIEWALSRLHFEYIFLINNDALIEADTVGLLIDEAEAHPSAGIIAPRIVVHGQPSVLWYGGGRMDWYRGGASAPGINGPSDTRNALESRYVDYASGCAMFIRRSFIEKVGMFDERFFMYEEDVNLCLRGSEVGQKIWYAPSAVAYHKRQASMSNGGRFYPPMHPLNRNLNFYLYNIVRNRLINLVEHTNSWLRIFFVIGMLMWLIRKAAAYTVHGNWKAIFVMVTACVDGYKASISHE